MSATALFRAGRGQQSVLPNQVRGVRIVVPAPIYNEFVCRLLPCARCRRQRYSALAGVSNLSCPIRCAAFESWCRHQSTTSSFVASCLARDVGDSVIPRWQGSAICFAQSGARRSNRGAGSMPYHVCSSFFGFKQARVAWDASWSRGRNISRRFRGLSDRRCPSAPDEDRFPDAREWAGIPGFPSA